MSHFESPFDEHSQIFESEGDEWYKRNFAKKPFGEISYGTSLLIKFFKENNLNVSRALEVGCSDGRNLLALHRELGCQVTGVEPGVEPTSRAREKLGSELGNLGWEVINSLPNKIELSDNSMDLIYFGFMLYLTPRDILSSVFREACRILDKSRNLNSYVAITDFAPLHQVDVQYSHNQMLTVFKRNYVELFKKASVPLRFTEIYKVTYSDDSALFSSNPERRVSTSVLLLER